ncbi:MAG TPA: N-acetylneuraminate synthase family protein [Vicinamibacterales bacterium]|nr:N-acetylneuraminate synthase family protein [Vicinamibacterales bacterium]
MQPEVPHIRIAGREVGPEAPLFVIAEIGLNHGGSLHRALALVDAAAGAGVDAIKLQAIEATQLVSPDCPAPLHVRARSLAQFFQTFELDREAYAQIIARARALDLAVLATPLSLDMVAMLQDLDIDGFKIASGDITWSQLIAVCADTEKPLVISTGMSDLKEVSRAVSTAQAAGARDVAVLHCVSAYPVPQGSENLRAIATLASECDVPVGLSDHSIDTFSVPIAVALGASLYERHIVLHGEEGDDAIDRAVSSTPAELAQVVRDARRTRSALGSGRKVCLDAEAGNRLASRRSIFAARHLAAGTRVSPKDFVMLRPATGLAPSQMASLVGRRLSRHIAAGQPVTEDSFAVESYARLVPRAV